MQTTNITPPEVGTHVFGSDGEEIGTISDVQAGYFQIKKGMLHRKEIFLPVNSIVGTALGGDGVTINLTKEEVDNGDWSQPPTSSEHPGDETSAHPS